MTPFVIPFFIAHQGCPHRCVFCNQRHIAGSAEPGENSITPESITGEIKTWLERPRKNPLAPVQVAFYGGSFTGIETLKQQEYLSAVQPFIASGRVASIRISTRPDYIDDRIVQFLKSYKVKIVELGVQSLDDRVLAQSGRGHTAKQVEDAVELLQHHGFSVGVQLMVGLPGETTKSLFEGVRQVIGMRPDFVRIYPVLIIGDTELEILYNQGRYAPLTLNRAVALTAKMKERFGRAAIRVVRMGLQPSVSLEKSVIAGPYHPAFGELVLSRIMFNKTRAVLKGAEAGSGRQQGVHIASVDESIFRGPGNVSFKRLASLGLLDNRALVLEPLQERNTVFLSAA
ncbi:MAG: radical SAM protein [Proteobacteria bacterium]|nr:radical SAM protein [Pseudomonadota bacterium]